jgi:hypothetical protein
MSPDDKVLLAVLGVRDAEMLASRLGAQGINIATIYNHSTCTTGCSPSKEIWAHVDDVPVIKRCIQEERLAMLNEMGVNLEQIEKVYDPSQGEATCPACGTCFLTAHEACPECGLQFV